MSIKVNLKGDSKEFESGISVAEIAKSIGAGLYKAACAGKVDGEVVDLRTPLTKDCNLEILTFSEEEGKKAYWHTAAHVLAQAVKRLFPDAKLAIGPAIDNGFYYDIDLSRPLSQEDLPKIEAEMKKIIKENLPIERFELAPNEAKALMQEQDQIYKVELIEEHADKGEATVFINKVSSQTFVQALFDGNRQLKSSKTYPMQPQRIGEAIPIINPYSAYMVLRSPKQQNWKNIWREWKKQKNVTIILLAAN